MAPIYSTQLYNAVKVGAFTGTVYTVPAGATVVVTNIDVWYDDALAGQTSYVVLGACIFLWHTSAGAEIANQSWSGKQVLNAGQTIAVSSAGIATRYAITGYLLNP